MRTFSGTVPRTFRNANVENQEPNGDRSQNDAHPEVQLSACRASSLTNSDPEETAHIVTGVQEITYCTLRTSSGKQRKACSTSQPKFWQWENPCNKWSKPGFVALQQLASSSNSAKFNNNINRISKLPKSLTKTMPIFDGKSEKFDFFENLFHTSLKILNQLRKENKIHYFRKHQQPQQVDFRRNLDCVS